MVTEAIALIAIFALIIGECVYQRKRLGSSWPPAPQPTMEEQLRFLSEAFRELGRQIGEVFIPALQKVAIAVHGLAHAIEEAVRGDREV